MSAGKMGPRAAGRTGTNSAPRTCRSVSTGAADCQVPAGPTAPTERAGSEGSDSEGSDHGSLDGEMPDLRTGIFYRHPNRRRQPGEASGCAREGALPNLRERALMVVAGGALRRRHPGEPVDRGPRSSSVRAVPDPARTPLRPTPMARPVARSTVRPTTRAITGWRRDALTGAATGALVFLCTALLFGACLL